MISRSIMVPEEGWGIMIMTNNVTSLSYALGYETLDRLLGSKTMNDWSAFFLQYKKQDELDAKEELVRLEEERHKDAPLNRPLADFAGVYSDQMYGDIKINQVGDQLAFQFVPTPLFRGTLRHWHHDIFRLNWGTQMMLPSGFASFVLDNQGNVSELKIDVPNPDFDFTELHFKKVD
jgi:hypothetical protein